VKVERRSHDFKKELADLIEKEHVKAVVMGNRRTDPFSDSLMMTTPSSEGWPKFLRVFPILEWTYDDIWLFLRMIGLPYCKLYDQGYSSLGLKSNTIKNPYLKGDEEEYLPAYMLRDGDSLERESRAKKKQ